MKPKIFIAMHYMELGGAEMALVGLLHALSPKRVNVDLFVYSHQGPLMKFIPKWVNLLPEIKSYAMIERPIKEVILAGQLGIAYGRLRAKRIHKAYMASLSDAERQNNISIYPTISKCLHPFLSNLYNSGEYELAISYLQPHDIVKTKVKAKKYVAWIHTDYSTVNINVKQELPIWSAYDHVISISPDVTKTFLQKFPSLANKIIEIENIMPKALIESRAEEFDVDWDKEGHTALATAPTQMGGVNV